VVTTIIKEKKYPKRFRAKLRGTRRSTCIAIRTRQRKKGREGGRFTRDFPGEKRVSRLFSRWGKEEEKKVPHSHCSHKGGEKAPHPPQAAEEMTSLFVEERTLSGKKKLSPHEGKEKEGNSRIRPRRRRGNRVRKRGCTVFQGLRKKEKKECRLSFVLLTVGETGGGEAGGGGGVGGGWGRAGKKGRGLLFFFPHRGGKAHC